MIQKLQFKLTAYRMKHTLFMILFSALYADALSVNLFPQSGTPPSPRELPGVTLDSLGKNLYVYGGISQIKHDDMWKYDLTSKRWSQIYAGSVLTPGRRSNAFMTALKDQQKLVLFGGDTSTGPASDVWVFDLENESVSSIQWKLIDDRGKVPPRSFYKSVCEYMHEGKQYIAVYGGIGKIDYLRSLFM